MVRRTHGNSQEHVTKHIFVTGGVVSSLGKGLTASSLGRLLRSRGIHVLQQKLDPYINVDPGTMNPFQHGEVYVTEDGAETDLDIGHYERFLDVFLSQKANVTTGQIYQEVLRKERAGEYLGQCVQVIPHITNEIKSRMRAQASDDVDVIITEIGGTVGDIESQPFLEAAREVRRDLGPDNCMFVHVSLVPYISAAHELKTKPTQHSVNGAFCPLGHPARIFWYAGATCPSQRTSAGRLPCSAMSSRTASSRTPRRRRCMRCPC